MVPLAGGVECRWLSLPEMNPREEKIVEDILLR